MEHTDSYCREWNWTGARLTDGPGKWKHTYPNAQDASLAWYHDHALGITRLNVYAGGAGGYIITDDVEQGYIDAPANCLTWASPSSSRIECSIPTAGWLIPIWMPSRPA